MEVIRLIIIIFLSSCFCGFTSAGQNLNEDQRRQVLKSLMSQTRQSWIPAGTIEGFHRHIDFETEEITFTKEKVRYDGRRFCWEIDILSRENMSQKIEPDKDTELDSKRLFAWDGNEYKMYFKSAGQAMVLEDPADIPVNVNGPLKAGVIPWGHGIYKLDFFISRLISAEIKPNGNLKMIMQNGNDYSIELELDPAKDYAVVSFVLERPGISSTSTVYQDYGKEGDFWIPSMIITEKLEHISPSVKKESRDIWEITSVDLTPLKDSRFKIDYDDNTHVEFRDYKNRVMSYRYKAGRNTEYMLQHRKYNISQDSGTNRNCAAAAINYIFSCLDKQINPGDYDRLVTGPRKSTSLFELDQFVKQNGLGSTAVNCNIETLSDLEDCHVILHLPEEKHYVVLDHIDDKNVWLVDLDSDKFYYPAPKERFDMDWKDRTALIISDKPFNAPAGCTEIPQARLHQIRGAEDFGKYSCTKLIQAYDIQFCSSHGQLCIGMYIVWYNRFGCELDPDGGVCIGKMLASNARSQCINDPLIPGSCTITGIWDRRYMRACK